MKKWRRLTAILIMIVMLPLQGSNIALAADIGGGIMVTEVNYYVDIDENYNITEINMEIHGTNLKNADILFSTNKGFEYMGQRKINLNGFLKYGFTVEEHRLFRGEIYIARDDGGATIKLDLDSNTFPTISSVTRVVNYSDGDDLVIKGNNLDKFGEQGNYIIRGEYYISTNETEGFGEGNKEYDIVTVEKAQPSGQRGKYSISIIKEKKSEITQDPKITIKYSYNNVFSFVSNIDVNEIEMYPNIGARGDKVYIQSAELSKAYDVYFFKTLDGTEKFSDKNRAVQRGFKDAGGTEPALLTIEVPQGIDLDDHYVVLAETINGQIVAQKVMKSDGKYTKYKVVDTRSYPTIDKVYKNEGPDTGGQSVQIDGKNLLRPSINTSELKNIDINNRVINLSDDKEQLNIVYNDAKYQDQPAKVTLIVRGQIGNSFTFQETEENGELKPKIQSSKANDTLFIITNKIDDADINPKKEVLVRITTVIEVGQKIYKLEDEAVYKHFTFIPSSLTPSIDSVTPSKIQLLEGGLKDDTLVSIKGKNFLVNRYMDSDGNTVINYPRILIKTEDLLDTNNYEFMIQKTNSETKAYLSGSGAIPDVVAEIMVLDDADRIVDGTVGREVGTRLLVKIPKEVTASIGMKNLQITNPTKGSNEAGQSNIKIDALEFVKTNNSPEIEKVEPNIVPVDGGQEIQVTGSNFLDDVEVFIDGKKVPGVNRDISPQGDKFILRFKAPKGREGTTQLLVMNHSSGGMAAAEFIYVETLQKDPKIKTISPNKGSKGTLVFIKGDNFLKPDPTTKDTSGIGIYRLIGTRVLLDGEDINDYHKINGNITLQSYKSKPDEPLIKNEGPIGAKLSDYYHSVILQETITGKYYIFDIDTADRIILSDGVQNIYRGFRASEVDGEYITTKDGQDYIIKLEPGTEAEGDKLVITDKGNNIIVVLDIMTPYAVSDGEIIGNKVKVLNRTEMIFYAHPRTNIKKWYDVSVKNPDTKTDTRQDGFYYYTDPDNKPIITSIEPSQGSVSGGYAVDINGSDFEDDGRVKSTVIIGGVEVPKSDILVSTDQKKITIINMPAYPGDLAKETESGRKTVPVVVMNSEGGYAQLEEGFTYIIPDSNPEIYQIVKEKGSAAGGDKVRIYGKGFRFREKFIDINGNERHDQGEEFEDINGDGKLTDLEGLQVENLSEKDKLILPKVYFGKERAEIIEYSKGYLLVILPKSEKGTVDVYVQNNDTGTSNKVKFTYEDSNPTIDSIGPPVGKKQGGDSLIIIGANFAKNKLDIYTEEIDTSGIQKLKTIDMPLIHFGDIKDRRISNRHIPITDSSGQGGNIINKKTKVEIGNLTVDYNANSDNKIVTFSIERDEETFSFTVNGYDDTEKYVDITSLRNSKGEAYDSGYELVRLEVDRIERKLIVERGYTPYHPNMIFSTNQITTYSPSHYAIGTVPVTIYNPDGGTATSRFTYTNPDSKPKITNITKDGRDPQLGKINNQDMLVHQISYRGGSTLSIIGNDFRENAIIQIGNVLTFTPNQIEYQLPDRLRVTMPALNENAVGRLYRVVVVNEDGASSASDSLSPPIYIQIIKGESAPTIESITPDSGPVKGGTKVTIKGKDFRETMDGYEGKELSVYFGEVKATEVKVIDYKTIEVITPPNVPGKVSVKVENPDGELAQPLGSFTYLSSPTISAVVDPLDPRENARITTISVEGGQTIKLKGSSFAQGARVVFTPVIKKAEQGQENNANAININGEWYILESGTSGTEINVQNPETIIVKTPQGKEGSKGVIVINPDKGASGIYEDLTYGLPKLEPPRGVEAELVYDRYIKIHWLEAEGAKSYEIYVVINNRETEYIGNTNLTTFVYENLEPNTRYRFIVKTMGEYGLSIASHESNIVRTGKIVGPPDTDGGITENTTINKTGSTVNIGIGTEDYYKRSITIDLTKIEYAGTNKAIITIPAEIVAATDSKNITILGADYKLSFKPNVFAHSNVLSNRDKKDSGIRFTIENNSGDNKAGNLSALSNQYLLQADFFVGKSSTKIDNIMSSIDLTLDFDSAKADLRKAKEVYLGRYDDYSSTWESILTETKGFNSSIRATINKLGRYTIFGKRG